MFSYKPLAKLLSERKVNLGEVAEKAGISESVLRCKMNESSYISMSVLDKLCNVLEVQPGDIIQWQKGEQTESKKYYVLWDKVNELSIRKGLSLNALSEKCRLNKSALWYAKKRNSQLRFDVVRDMSKALGCSFNDIVEN